MKIVLTTFPANKAEDAENNVRLFASALVENRLAACVNINPAIESVYSWEGKIEIGQECLLIIKTTSDKLEGLEAYFKDNHPYKVFEFVTIDPEVVGKSYQDWVRSCLCPTS